MARKPCMRKTAFRKTTSRKIVRAPVLYSNCYLNVVWFTNTSQRVARCFLVPLERVAHDMQDYTRNIHQQEEFLQPSCHLHDWREWQPATSPCHCPCAAPSTAGTLAFFPYKTHRSGRTIVNHVCHRLGFWYCASGRFDGCVPCWQTSLSAKSTVFHWSRFERWLCW